MNPRRPPATVLLALIAAGPATRPAPPGKLPHIAVDVKGRTVRVDCQAVAADYPLEFLAVVTGTNEYEAIVRTAAKPSQVHLALLLVGLTPGTPVHYSEATQTWLPPAGPPVDVWFEYVKDGKPQRVPAYRWMRDVRTHKEATPFTWCFTGSQTIDGVYAADQTGSLVGVINNQNSVLDVPALRGRSMEAREYERNPDLMPPMGTAVTMMLSPAGALTADVPVTQPTTTPVPLSGVHEDQPKVDALKQHWQSLVLPHRRELQEAAQAHYEAIAGLRCEQQRLIDEADHIQRTIDELEREYAGMTTPQPGPATRP